MAGIIVDPPDGPEGLLGVRQVPGNGARDAAAQELPRRPRRGPKPNMSVDLGGVRLPMPVMVASGCYGPELGHLTDVRKLGGVVSTRSSNGSFRDSSGPACRCS